MHRHRIHAAIDQRRCQGDSEKDVGRRHRHADPQDEAGQRAHDQQHQHIATGNEQQIVGDGAGHTRNGECPHDQAHAGHQAGQLGKQRATGFRELLELLPLPATVLAQLVDHQQQGCRVERRYGLLLHEQQHPDQEGENEDVVPAFLQGLPDLRQIDGRQALEPIARRIEVDLDEQTKEIQRRGDGCGQGDLAIGNIQEGRHHERRGAHDRRHQYAAGGRAGLHAGCVGLGETDLAHGGDRQGAGGQHVGDHTAGHRAHQAAGEDRHLGWTAADLAEQSKCQVDEELATAGALQGDTEQQKTDHQVGEGLGGNAQQAFIAVGVVDRDQIDGRGNAGKTVRQITRQHRKQRRQKNHHKDGPAAAAPGGFQCDGPGQQTDIHHMLGGHVFPALIHGFIGVDDEEHTAANAGQGQQPVIPGGRGHPATTTGGNGNKHHRQHHCQQAIDVLAGEHGEAGVATQIEDLVDGQGGGRYSGDSQQSAGYRMADGFLFFGHGMPLVRSCSAGQSWPQTTGKSVSD